MNAPAQHHGYRDLSESEIEEALGYLDANMPRAEWARIGMAIKSELGERGLAMFDRWSQKGDSYDEKDTRDTWKSISASGGVTIATLIGKAIPEGFSFDEKNRTPISQEEVAKRERERKQREEAEAKVKTAKREAAAMKANAIWDGAQDIEGDDHPYLKRKGVLAHGVRVGPWKGAAGYLLIPARNMDGEIVSLQAIAPNEKPTVGRAKDFLWDGQKQGTMHWLGDVPNESTVLFVVTGGYATGGSIHLATGYSVALAWDDGNLPVVAAALRKKYPRAIIIVAGDNDKYGKANSGLHAAQQACTSARGLMAMPKFADESSQPTDFNDLHQLEGLGAVRGQINSVLPKADNDNDPDGPMIPLEGQVNTFDYPHKSEKHQPLNTWENLQWLLKQYGITARYNVVKKDVDVHIPGRDFGQDSAANLVLSEIRSICARNRMPKEEIDSYIKLIGIKNKYNPAEELIRARPWDGVTRLPKLYATLTTPPEYDRSMLELLLRKWLISAVAAILRPNGFWSKGVLVLQGPQSLGKTAWLKALLPVEQRNLWKIGAIIDPANKDTISSAIGHWMVELGELDGTFRKADIARLKAFISQDIDQLRRPYDRLESSYQRRTVFAASVNPEKFLADETGNVRWWTIPVIALVIEHGIDMQQLWAEVATIYESGERWWLEPDEEARLEGYNREHEQTDPVEEQIAAAFDWDKPALRPVEMTASEVLVAIGYDKPSKSQATQASDILRKLTGKKPRRTGKGRYFSLPSAPRVRNWAKPQQQRDDDTAPL